MLKEYINNFREKYYQNRGQRHLSRGNKDKAYQCFQKALLIDSNYINLYNMGLVLITMNQHKHALEYLEKVRKQFPENEVVLTTLAETYTLLRNWDEVISIYQGLKNEHPDFELYKKNLVRSKDPVAREKYARSRELFFKGMTEQENKQLNQAIDSLKEAIELDPENAMLYNTIGITMMMAGKSKAEITPYFEKAVQLSPKNEGYKHNLAKIKMQKK